MTEFSPAGQALWPVAQLQAPWRQICWLSGSQLWLQAPQCWPSICRLTHSSPHRVCPLGHAMSTQVPAVQVLPLGQ
jgi:hypothetical protein